MHKVLLTDNIAQEALDVFSDYPDIEVVSVGTLGKDELAAMLPEYAAVIVRSPTKLTGELIEAGAEELHPVTER